MRVRREHGRRQGDGVLTLRLEWKAERHDGSLQPMCALLQCNPWLAYGCAEGARLMIRKAADTMGKCATVQRTLRDDSVVVRADGTRGLCTRTRPCTCMHTAHPLTGMARVHRCVSTA